jgi:hypothetical protein
MLALSPPIAHEGTDQAVRRSSSSGALAVKEAAAQEQHAALREVPRCWVPHMVWCCYNVSQPWHANVIACQRLQSQRFACTSSRSESLLHICARPSLPLPPLTHATLRPRAERDLAGSRSDMHYLFNATVTSRSRVWRAGA